MRKVWKRISILFVLSIFFVAILQSANSSPITTADKQNPNGNGRFQQADPGPNDFYVSEPVRPIISPPVSELPIANLTYLVDREQAPRRTLDAHNLEAREPSGLPGITDPLLGLQKNAPTVTAAGFTTPILNFDGQGYTGVTPPDTDGDVGLNHYIQVVNGSSGAVFTIYDKNNGAVLSGPHTMDSLGTANCASGYGDGIVLYDWHADRWLLSELANNENHLCVYVSQTNDPTTTSWYLYDFISPEALDSTKFAVWPDAYYVSSNESSPAAYALDRSNLLNGAAATFQRRTATPLTGFGIQSLTPSDLDGDAPPPVGSPNYFLRHRDDEAHNAGTNNPVEDYLEIWAFDVDWTTPANSTFSKVADLPITEFDSTLCGLFSFQCFPQQGSTLKLDPLRETVMFRLQYRNFGIHESLVGNLVTDVDGTDHGGIRWFELRKVGANPWTKQQEGTYAPDALHRWTGGIAMDSSGHMAMGYSVTSSSMYPSLRYVGRLSSDPPGTLPQGEHSLVSGTSPNLSTLWGDHSRMSIDPVDDCTFWYTNMYAAGDHWKTRIAKFKFDECGNPDFELSVEPTETAVCVPDDAVYEIAVDQVAGFTDPVTLSLTGKPAGTTSNFNPNAQATPYNSTLTIGNTGSALPGKYALEITGVSPTSTHTTTAALSLWNTTPGAVTLTSPADDAGNVPVKPTFTWQPVLNVDSYTIEIASDAAFNNIIESENNIVGTSFTAATTLNTNGIYYWRIRPANACGPGSYSPTFNFMVEPPPGECPPGITPYAFHRFDFESGTNGWTHTGQGDTWSLSNLDSHSGDYSFQAKDGSSISDQYLISPNLLIPAGGFPLTLQFWNYQDIESFQDICFDGAVLELSSNGGASWTRLDNELLTDPYDGPITTLSDNPLGGEEAWCGNPQDWLNSIVDLDLFAGQLVQFRFRLATDNTVSHDDEGWYVDDMIVQSCAPNPGEVYLPAIIRP